MGKNCFRAGALLMLWGSQRRSSRVPGGIHDFDFRYQMGVHMYVIPMAVLTLTGRVFNGEPGGIWQGGGIHDWNCSGTHYLGGGDTALSRRICLRPSQARYYASANMRYKQG